MLPLMGSTTPDDAQSSVHGGIFVVHDSVERLHPHGETSHTEHGITFLVEGWIKMEHGGDVRVEPGSVVLVPAGVPHRAIDGRDLEYWLVGFCATCVRLDETQLLMQPFLRVREGTLPVVPIAKSRRARFTRLLKDLKDEIERGAPESCELGRCLLLLLLGEIRRAMPTSEFRAGDGSLVASALQYIQVNSLKPISLKDVAAHVHRTAAHVATTVKEATGYSVGAWITSGRVGEAASRLAHSDDTLDEIALHVGWQDKTHFIRQFKKAYGVTPAAWRRTHSQEHATRGRKAKS